MAEMSPVVRLDGEATARAVNASAAARTSPEYEGLLCRNRLAAIVKLSLVAAAMFAGVKIWAVIEVEDGAVAHPVRHRAKMSRMRFIWWVRWLNGWP